MSKFFNPFSILALLAALLGGAVTYSPARAASVLRAKPAATGSGDCTTWADACTLQTAIASAVSGDQIWVKAGTHIPDPSDRTVSFTLKNGVAIYGGFNGTETQLSQRNPAVNITTLSGDIGAGGNNSDNSYHVVRASNVSSNTILDGFTISGGNANGTSPHNVGGGMFNSISSATLSKLIFSVNSSAEGGGAMYNQDGSNLKLTNVTFSENSSNYGGGMNNFSSSPTLANVIFSDNSASNAGGGISNYLSNPTLTNVTFSGNSASNNGGGINNNTSNPILTKVTFSGNSASNVGGGIYNLGSNPTLTNVTFSGNSAPHGGGIFNDGNSNPTLTNATFNGNSAPSGNGGAVTNVDSSPSLTNVTFSGNSAGNLGGGMYTLNGSPPLKNVTFSGNSAASGGGMRYDNSNVILVNVIIANSTGGGDCVSNGTLSVAASINNLIESPSNACGLTDGGAKRNILGADPKLGPLANNGGLTKTMALKNGSPAIDSGNDAKCPAKDQRGQTRPKREHCDIGAYEAPYVTGDLDTTFSRDGVVTTNVVPSDTGLSDQIWGMALQSDGKIVVAGFSFKPSTAISDFALARYKPDGTLDFTFSSDGRLTTDFGGIDEAWDVVVQPDGKIIAAGRRCLNGVCDAALARYNANGTLDNTFSGDGKVLTDFQGGNNGSYGGLALQPDGKILLAGYAERGADLDFAVYRYNANGTPDTTFSGDGVAVGNFGPGKQDYTYDLAIQGNGKIVVAGQTGDDGNNDDFAIARLNPNGSADTTFSGDGRQTTNFGADDSPFGLALQPDGKIVVVGEKRDSISHVAHVAVARYNPNGSLDTTFNSTGKKVFNIIPGRSARAWDVIVQPNGKIVIIGVTDNPADDGNFILVRLNSNGGPDTTFSGDGKVAVDITRYDHGLALARQSDGKYVLGGTTGDLGVPSDFALARILP